MGPIDAKPMVFECARNFNAPTLVVKRVVLDFNPPTQTSQ
jgi:hypothetical protein